MTITLQHIMTNNHSIHIQTSQNSYNLYIEDEKGKEVYQGLTNKILLDNLNDFCKSFIGIYNEKGVQHA